MSLKILRRVLMALPSLPSRLQACCQAAHKNPVVVIERMLRNCFSVRLFPVFYGMCAMKGAAEIQYREMGNVSYAEVSKRFDIRILQNLTII